MSYTRLTDKFTRLSWFIYCLCAQRFISRSQAMNMLDRLAIRADEMGEQLAHESISTLFLMIQDSRRFVAL